jgi:acyl-CoA synthetase (AMP-forming)/AMP-acid ligase II
VYDPPSIVDAIQSERCTALHGVPTHFIGVLAEIEKRRGDLGCGKLEGFDRLRTGIAAGSPIPIDLMKRLIREMGLDALTVAYGMSR